MKLKSYFLEKYLADTDGVPTLAQLRGNLLEELYDASQDTEQTYVLRTAIGGKLLLDKECPFMVIGFVIMPDCVIMQVQGQQTARIQAKWSRIAEEVFGVPVDVAWGNVEPPKRSEEVSNNASGK